MDQADDVERVEAGCRAQPHSLYKRRVAEKGGDAGGGSTLGTQSTFAQMGHIDSPGRSRLNRDIHFEKSPKDEAPRRWHGQSVRRRVEVEDSDGRVASEALRFVVVHSSQLAQQQTQTYAAAQVKEAEAVANHARHVHAQWFACRPDAEAAIAADQGQGQGHRGRHPRPWPYHPARYTIAATTRRTRRPPP